MALDLNSIRGLPDEANDYEFIIVKQTPTGLEYVAHTENGWEAEEVALAEPYALVLHNVRIQGKREKPKNKYYTFSGMWSWGCWAENIDDAKRQFEDVYNEDIDIDTDHVEIEVDDD